MVGPSPVPQGARSGDRGGTPLFDLIRTPYRDDMPFIVTMGEVASYRKQSGLSPLPELTEPVATLSASGHTGVGSNNWVIEPSRTDTGSPIVANDMHLAVQIPSIWYEIGLHLEPAPGSTETPLNLRGFSFAALPYPDSGAFYELSLGWTALQPETLWTAVVGLNRATNIEDIRAALAHWDSPAQNIVFADDQGNIGYQSVGSFPNRPPTDDRGPTPGWEHEDNGLVSFTDFPAALNPKKDFIVTANNPVVSPDYPYPLGIEFANGLRAKRIVEMIESLGTGIGMEEVGDIHADVFNGSADEDAPRAEDERTDDLDFLTEAAAVLLSWDRRMDPDAAGAAAFGFVWKQLITDTFKDEMPAHYWPFTGVTTFESAIHVLLGEPDHAAWDDRTTGDRTEDRDDIFALALVDGFMAAREELGDKVNRWEWGDLHQIEFRNATLGESGIGPIERLFNRGPYPLAGGSSTVNG